MANKSGLWNHRMRVTIAVVLLLVVAVPISWASSTSLRGRMAARRDIKNGVYRELAYGLPGPWNESYVRLLKQKYNVEVRRVAGCIVTNQLTEYVRGYDDVSEKAANSKFGRNIFDETYREASAKYAAPAPSSLPPMKN